MSTDDSQRPNEHRPDPVQNPYSVPDTDPQGFQQVGPISLPVHQQRGMVNQAVIVGVLMVVHGVINSGVGVVFGFYGLFMPAMFEEIAQQQAANGGQPMPANLGTYIAIGCAIAALILIALGLLLVYAGVSVASYKRRSLAIIALLSGMITIFTCYCFPTSLLLAIYGMIFLFNQPVAFAFELRRQGYSAQEIQKSFLSLP